jgi:hypothetical protein
MKKNLLILVLTAVLASSASAATEISYIASASPSSNPDANTNTVDVWAYSASVGNSFDGLFDKNSSFANASLTTPWQLGVFGTDAGAFSQADHTFAGGALTIGQTVSIKMANTSIAGPTPGPAGSIGFELRNGSSPLIRFGFNGGDTNYFIDAPGGGSGFTASSSPYQVNTVFTLSITITGAGAFHLSTSGMTGGDTNYDGTYDTSGGTLDVARVYSFQAGDNSDVTFNNLEIVPEPASLFLISAGGLGLICWRRFRRR